MTAARGGARRRARACLIVLAALAASLGLHPADGAAAAAAGVSGAARAINADATTTPPPAPDCRGGQVPAYLNHRWRCETAGSAIDDGLTLIASEVPGLHSTGSVSTAARTAVGSAIPARRAGHAAAAAAFRGTGRRLSTATFTRHSAAGARALVGSVGHGFHPLKGVGDQAVLQVTGGTSQRAPATAVIVLRVDRAVGVVRIAGGASRPRSKAARAVTAEQARHIAATIAGDYAVTLAARLKRVLALTPWQRTLDRIGPTGTVSKVVALRAFALQYGPLPGVKVPSGPTGASASGTMAIGMVLRAWGRLSSAQRTAIDRDLDLPASRSLSQRAHAAAVPAPDPALTPDAGDQALAEHWRQVYVAKLPSAPPVTVRVFRVDGLPDKALADALPVNAAGAYDPNNPAYCRIRVGPGVVSAGTAFHNLVLAHEVFHCFQFVLNPDWPSLGLWIREGMADWAALTVDPVAVSVGGANYTNYLGSADQLLFGRSYDGVGFWGYADQADGAGSLWAKIPAILNAGSSAAAFVTAGGTADSFLQTWASATLRYRPAGRPWFQTDPYAIPFLQLASPVQSITGDAQATSSPYAVGLDAIDLSGESDLIAITPEEGTTRAAVAPGGTDLGVISSEQWFCTDADGCDCPPGTEGNPPPSSKVGDGTVIYTAVTGGAGPGAAGVSFRSLEDFCHPKDDGGGSGGGSGTGRTGIAVYKPTDSGEQLLGDMTTGSCSVSDGAFDATASGDGFEMHVHVPGATQPNHLYIIPSNSSSSYVTVNGYSSQAALKTGLGALKFKSVTVGGSHQLRVSIGYDALFSGSNELVIAPEPGGLVC